MEKIIYAKSCIKYVYWMIKTILVLNTQSKEMEPYQYLSLPLSDDVSFLQSPSQEETLSWFYVKYPIVLPMFYPLWKYL